MFKPARLCHVRTLCVHAQPLSEGTVTFSAQVVTFQLFAHVGNSPFYGYVALHIDYYANSFSVGVSFCTDNCNKFMFP